MTFRRRLTLMVVVIIFTAILVTGMITSAFINRYFKDFLSETYDQTIDLLTADAAMILQEEADQISLVQYLNDPITTISVYYKSGDLLYYESDHATGRGRMHMPMFFEGETDQFDIKKDGQLIGYLVVERSTKVQNSETVMLFNFALLRGAFFAAVVAMVLSLILSKRLSKGITNDLKETADFANGIEAGSENLPSVSKTIEIRSIQRQLVTLSRKLKLQNRNRKAKIDQISHESKTPITILKSQLEGTLDGVLEMDNRRLISCLEAVNRLDGLTKDMSSVLEIEADDIKVSKKSFDLMEELRVIQTGLSLQFADKGLNFELQGPEHVLLHSDRTLLSQSLYNLIVNSLKFTEKGGVTITVDDGDDLIINISDTGIGIASDKLDQIFEPYYRAVSKETFAGDGLGLYIVKRNIIAIGADITVNSQQGKGTQFEVRLCEKRI